MNLEKRCPAQPDVRGVRAPAAPLSPHVAVGQVPSREAGCLQLSQRPHNRSPPTGSVVSRLLRGLCWSVTRGSSLGTCCGEHSVCTGLLGKGGGGTSRPEDFLEEGSFVLSLQSKQSQRLRDRVRKPDGRA